MKILRLDLSRFGPFTDLALDLAEGHEGLHLIYGPNEAGKTSALRALRQAFFGIDVRSPDDFLHKYAELRVGATIRNGDGATLEFVRRKGNKNTLLAADGTVLDEAALAPFLRRVNREEFETLFAIDHDELVRGGQAIIRGGGDIGQLLFTAGSGLAGLRDVQASLDREMEELFKPGGARPKINADLALLGEARRTIKERALPSADWHEHDQAHRQALARLVEVEEQLGKGLAEKRRLERLQQAIPSFAKRKECLTRLAELGPFVLLAEEFPERRIEAVTHRDAAREAEAAALRAIADLDREIEALVVPEDLIAQADAIERLRDALPSFRKGQRDLPTLLGKCQQVEADAAEILRELRPDLILDQADSLKLSKSRKAVIQNLGNDSAGHVTELRKARENLEQETERLQAELQAMRELDDPSDPAELIQALRRVQDLGDVEAQWIDARRDLAKIEAQAAHDLARLPHWIGALEALERLPVPSTETIHRFEADFAAAETTRATVQARLQAETSRRDDALRGLDQLQLSGEVPVEDDLDQSRRRRDLGWQLVRRSWKLDNAPSPAEVRDFTRLDRDLTDAYEQAVRAADDLADRLRREADRVAQRAQLLAALRKSQAQLDALETDRQLAERQRDQHHQRWSDHWRPLDINPLPPREMRVWSQAQDALVLKARQIRESRGDVEALEQRIDAHRDELDQALQRLGEPPARPDESLAAVRDRAQAIVERRQGTETRRANLTRSVAKLTHDRESAQAKVDRAENALDDWRRRWAEAVAPLGLTANASPEEANHVIAQTAELFAKIKETHDAQARIESIQREAAQFTLDVRGITERVAPDLAVPHVDRAAETLIAQLKKAAADQTRREALQAQRDHKAAEAEAARATIQARTALLTALCQDARRDRPEDLPDAERLSERARALQHDLQRLDEQLLQLSGNATIDEFHAAAEALDIDRLPDQIRGLAETIARLEAEKAERNQTIGHEQSELARMDGGTRAAEAAEQAENLRSRLASEVEQYARLRLASAVLRDAIDRHRQKSQGPVLARAGRLFADLTVGSFESLRVDYDDHDEPVLKGVRAGGREAVGVNGLSDGTADQLYLALRLASLESFLDKNDPMPLIVDDLLIQFDDDRSTATLKALADLSGRTQVLFFIHHAHLRALAEAHLDPGTLFTHELSDRLSLASSTR